LNTDELNTQTIDQQPVPQTGDNISQYESDEKYNEAFDSIKSEIDTNVQFANENNDWREIRNRLNISKDKLKALFLKDDDNNSLLDLINSTIENVNNRQSEEQDKFDKESIDNYNSVIDKVKESVQSSIESTDFKQSRELLLNAQELFKNLKLKRSHRDELYKLINEAFDDLTRRQIEERENYEMECIENYHNLKSKVDSAIEFALKSEIFAKAREVLIKVQNDIKGMKLKREQRDELYQLIRSCFDDVNKRQDEDRKSFETDTEANYIKLKKIAEDAVAFAKNTEEFVVAREQLINAQNAIKGMKLKREQRDELYAVIRVVFDDLNGRQSQERADFDKECEDNFKRLTQKVDDSFALVHGITDFRMIRETLITVQSEVKISRLKKDQRTELFSRIREAFSIFDKKRNDFFDTRKDEKRKKLIDIKANLDEKLARLQDLLKRDEDSLLIMKNRITEAGEDEYLVNDINQKINNIESRIKEKSETIEQTSQRLTDIDKELGEIE
jgi:hypothetical protein